MPDTVTVGLDGSKESEYALDWAAREALRRQALLDIVQVREAGPYPYPSVMDDQTEQEWSARITHEAAAGLAERYPTLRTTTHRYAGRPTHVLVSLSGSSDLLVLGSRRLGSVIGFLVGSVALPTVAHVRCPVVLRNRGADEDSREEDAGPDAVPGPVALGLRLDDPPDALVSFAFQTARRWKTSLRVVHGWDPPPAFGVRPVPIPPRLMGELTEEKTEALRKSLQPWQDAYPSVEVDARAEVGRQAPVLLTAAADASLVVVGRRNRRHRYGTHIGSVTHAVLHHADTAVAVVPHD